MIHVKWFFSTAIIALFFLSGFPTFAEQSPTATPRVGKVLSADKVEIVYTIQGKGETTLIFIHGGFADRSFWVNQMKPFSEKYQVIAIDLAGHGQSGTNRVKWTIPAFAQDVKAVMEQENVLHAVLVGNSLGGPVILETARLVPDKVVGLIAVDTFQSFNFPRGPASAYLETAKAYRTDFAGMVKKMLGSLFNKDANPTLYAEVEQKMLNCPGKGEMGAGLYEYYATIQEFYSLKNLTQPIRCINGDIHPTQIEDNRAIYPNFDAIIMPHTGHYPMLEAPELFNQHLTEILKTLLK